MNAPAYFRTCFDPCAKTCANSPGNPCSNERTNGCATHPWTKFSNQVAVVRAEQPADVVPALNKVAAMVEAHALYAVGFVAYEAAPAFDPALSTHRPCQAPGETPGDSTKDRMPLLCFTLYEKQQRLSIAEFTQAMAPPDAAQADAGPPAWHGLSDFDAYAHTVTDLLTHIHAGDLYQINFTTQLSATAVCPRQLGELALHDAPYGAYFETDDLVVASASPELFFKLDGQQITSKPMKGTAARGLTNQADRQQGQSLARSIKDRAENLMILDMVRNDLGRICKPGSITVPAKFDVEKYPTIWQMTSTVKAQTTASLAEIFTALFPGASITGAPKRAAMDYIKAAEQAPRGIYTGAVGVVAPGRQALFNIAIRTAWLHKSNHRAHYGVGSGIVADSTTAGEWAELSAKTQVLHQSAWPDFELLETMRWSGSGIYLLDRHLARLVDSAEYFGFTLDVKALSDFLHAKAKHLPRYPLRCRLTLARNGCWTFTTQHPAPAVRDVVEVPLAQQCVTSKSLWLYHKTTRRDLYAAYERPFGREVLLYNEVGNVTESTIANLVYEYRGKLYTPPQQDGLLPGVLRAQLLATGTVDERSIHRRQLPYLPQLYLVNALRGWRRCRLAGNALY